MDRYIGLDAHTSSCTVAVIGPSGKRLRSVVVETNAAALIEGIRMIPGTRHLCLEEGTHSEWLYEVLSPHVQELVVKGVGQRVQGSKSDKLDAFGLAEQLRIGAIETGGVAPGAEEWPDGPEHRSAGIVALTTRISGNLHGPGPRNDPGPAMTQAPC